MRSSVERQRGRTAAAKGKGAKQQSAAQFGYPNWKLSFFSFTLSSSFDQIFSSFSLSLSFGLTRISWRSIFLSFFLFRFSLFISISLFVCVLYWGFSLVLLGCFAMLCWWIRFAVPRPPPMMIISCRSCRKNGRVEWRLSEMDRIWGSEQAMTTTTMKRRKGRKWRAIRRDSYFPSILSFPQIVWFTLPLLCRLWGPLGQQQLKHHYRALWNGNQFRV